MNRLKYHIRKLAGLPVDYYFERAKVPAATHLPILMTLGALFPVKRILEFGAGSFSTLAFLNRAIFPQVELVRSLESDPDWHQRVRQQAGGDNRLQLLLISEEVHKEAAKCDFSAFDLIFVDNGPNADARVATIKEVANRCHESNLVVVHDFENQPYQRASRPLRQRFCFDAYCPHTAVLWKRGRIDKPMQSSLKRMNKAFAQHARQAEPTDVETWLRIVTQAARTVGGSTHSPI